ncbi:hypothetical protein CNE01520 [Cryptococcus deneoformans JEC21]|uniref:Uncharacterized protein n=1 Tax=Cryptococcus deneoformans (strain JEC21 / ATCC MYA-565) TaxID=214684 RepID=Q5KH23_CRYD1|nr:hypothetical protein CNE01520 [Cryptococcus neoformans var. neoformans JEC21]AAW43456.1 hypothetical protein CNE01520 [Cryptococcus neoformans var. neoformans JEC21]
MPIDFTSSLSTSDTLSTPLTGTSEEICGDKRPLRLGQNLRGTGTSPIPELSPLCSNRRRRSLPKGSTLTHIDRLSSPMVPSGNETFLHECSPQRRRLKHWPR